MSDKLPEVRPVASVDLLRYSGRWYEIGRLPLHWEPEGVTDVTADYTPDGEGKLRVDNRCFDADGKPTQSIGEARAADESGAKLRVSFMPEFLRWVPFTDGEYWVLKVDDEYRTALVGSPDRKHLWLVHREPTLAEDVRADYMTEAKRQDFSLEGWIDTVQDGRRVTDEMLASS